MKTEISYDDAWRVINADYWDDVRGIAAEAKRLVKDGEATDDESLYELLNEHIDSHQRVIYTHQARIGLCCTNNVDIYEDETGERPPGVEAQMFAALLADVLTMVSSYDDLASELAEESES
jgi:hypothetical protein